MSGQSNKRAKATRPPLWARWLCSGVGSASCGRFNRGTWVRLTPRVWGLEREDEGSGVILRLGVDVGFRGDGSHLTRLRNHAAWAGRLCGGAVPTPAVLGRRFFSLGVIALGVVVEERLTGGGLERGAPGHCGMAGGLLARLHGFSGRDAGGAGEPGCATWLGKSFPLGSGGSRDWWEACWGGRLADAIRQLGRGSHDGKTRSLLVERGRRILDRVRDRVLPLVASTSRWRPVHGDIHPENFRFDSLGVMRLIDLEWMHFGLAEIDLSHARRRVCLDDRPEEWEAFQKAYREAGGSESLDSFYEAEGLWLAIHDLRRAASLARRIRRGRKIRTDQTAEDWLDRAEAALDSDGGGKP